MNLRIFGRSFLCWNEINSSSGYNPEAGVRIVGQTERVLKE